MAEALTLGGKVWNLPPLPWRIVRKAQPAIVRFFEQAGGSDMPNMMKLTTEEFDALAGVVYSAASFVEPALTREQFDDLAFAPIDLIMAIPIVSKACGLVRSGGVEVSPDAGKVVTETPGPA